MLKNVRETRRVAKDQLDEEYKRIVRNADERFVSMSILGDECEIVVEKIEPRMETR